MDIDWTAVSSIASTLALLYIVVYQDQLKDRWNRPKLILSFDKDKDVVNQRGTVDRPDSEMSRWLRIGIRSKNGRRAAKGCRAYLVRIERKAPGSNVFEDVSPTGVRALAWEHGKEEYFRDLLPGIQHRVDLLAGFGTENIILVQSYPPYPLPNPGQYTFTVQVSAEDAEPEIIKVAVESSGTWNAFHGMASVSSER